METINMDAPIVQAFNVVTQFYSATASESAHTRSGSEEGQRPREHNSHDLWF